LKLIVAGSREISNRELIYKHLDLYINTPNLIIVSGKARGPDTIGEEWAKERKILVKEFPADWDFYGKSAGFIRNQQMAEFADELIVFWDGVSKGTKHMLSCMLKVNKPSKVILVHEPSCH
jgi:hypothetical protein